MSPAHQIEFARRFGDIHRHLFNKAMDDYPQITELLKVPTQAANAGGRWHSDQMYTPQPAKATMLYSRELPAAGGDTMFASMYRAYDALSSGMKAMLAGLRGVSNGNSGKHPSGMTREERVAAGTIHMAQIDPGDAQTIASHPAIRTHPDTGRRALYVNRLMTEELTDMPAEESDALLADLFDMVERDEFHYTHTWLPGDLLIWDNRGAQHARTEYPLDQSRLLRRVGIQGDKPF